MFDLSFHQLLIRAGACILITSIYGFVLAALARGLGDSGPQSDGRLTINPIDHLDVLGAAALGVLDQVELFPMCGLHR